jgi:translocation and assembly module TamB
MSLRKFIVMSPIVFLAVIAGTWFWLLHTESGARHIWSRATDALGGALQASEIRGDLGSGLILELISYDREGVHATVERFQASVDVDLLTLSVEIRDVLVNTARLKLVSSDGKNQASADVEAVLGSLNLPLDIVVSDFAANDVIVSGVVDERNIMITEARFDKATWHEVISISGLAVAMPEANVQAAAQLGLQPPYAVSLNGSIAAAPELTGLRDVVIELEGNGNVASLNLTTVEITGEDLRLTGDAQLDLRHGLALASRIHLHHMNVNAIVDTWPEAHPLSGTLAFDINDERLLLSDTKLAVANSAMRLQASGKFDFASSVVAAKLIWNDVQWPVDADQAVWSSNTGDTEVSGSLEDWRVQGRIALAAAGVDDGAFTIDGGGDRDHVALNIVDGLILGGAIAGDFEYSWRDTQPFSTDLQVRDIDTSGLFPDWPVVVSGHLDANGQTVPLQLQATLEDVNGVVLDQPMSAKGHIDFGEGQFVARQLELQHGDNELRLNGGLRKLDGVQFAARVDDLGSYLAAAEGGLQVSGSVSHREDTPRLQINGASDALRFGDIEFVGLSVEDQQNPDALLATEVRADEIIIAGEHLGATALNALATSTSQSLTLRTAYRELKMMLGLQGTFDDWQAPSQWNGEVDALTIEIGDFETATLTKPAKLSLWTDNATVEHLCLADSQDAGFCADASWLQDRAADLSAELRALPVNAVNLIRDTGFELDQLLSGKIQWRGGQRERMTGSANMEISAGAIRRAEQADVVVQTDRATVDFVIVDGTLLSGTAQIPLPGTGNIDGHFEVLDVSAGTSSAVEGNLKMSMNDINVLSALSPLLDEAGGSLQADLELSGTLRSPMLVGQVDVNNGSLRYLPIGLQLEEINLSGSLLDDRHIEFNGSFLAGGGTGDVVARAEYDETSAAALHLELHGENLKIIDVPEVHALADIDIEVDYTKDSLTLGGEILIPKATISPTKLTQSRTQESADVVIVAGQLAGAEQAIEPRKTQVFGQLDVLVGDDVRVDLDLAKAQVTGAAELRWSGELMPVADGRIDLSGDIEALGQVLRISEGVIRFANGPADDPELRIRAEREIYGNTQVRQAGMLVSGTAKQPTLQAYTVPVTTEERALTLLVTGNDFDYEKGVGAIGFGTYIAPKLFVSYGVGLFENDNVIGARYDLSRGFGIKATSGQKQSGVDLVYQFER